MAEEVQTNTWSLPEFCFKVNISDVGEMFFKEVRGLDAECNSIESLMGETNEFMKVRTPGLIRNREITLKQGVFVSDMEFWAWIGEFTHGKMKRREVTISLLDEKGNSIQTWKLANTWQKKITIEKYTVDRINVEMQTLVLSHEGITIG